MRARSFFALIALLALVALPGAQIPATPAGKPTDQSLVRLDIHATADGRPITDLTAEELSIIEDDSVQKIDTLRHAADPARTFIVFLDTPHMRFEGARDVRVPLVRFLDRMLDDDDVLAVVTPDLAP